MTVGGPVGPTGLAGFTTEVETGRRHFSPVRDGHDARSSFALLRKGVGVRGGPVLELRLRGGGTGQRSSERTQENQDEENSTLHTSHPRMSIGAFTSHLNDALTGL